MWDKIPFVDETINTTNAKVPNSEDIWPKIMADFDFARTTLAATKDEIGRINKWGAAAMMQKRYFIKRKYAEARPIFTDVITNGTNAAGTKLALAPAFHDLFNADRENDVASSC